MVCEILNSNQDTYVNMHCLMTLGSLLSLCKVQQSHQQGIESLLVKLTNLNIGLKDHAATYLGHTISVYFSKCWDSLSKDNLISILRHCLLSVAKPPLPLVAKSLSLPISFVFSSISLQDFAQLRKTFETQHSHDNFRDSLKKMIELFSETSKKQSNSLLAKDHELILKSLGLQNLLELTCQDNQLAGLKLVSNQGESYQL
jgi:hypothetical protein